MATILMPLSSHDFDPTETGVPCAIPTARWPGDAHRFGSEFATLLR